MRLVSKSQIGKFSNESYSMQSMMELMGRQPHHISKIIRQKPQYSMGLLSITEGLGNVYMEEKGFTKLKDIDTYSFTWNVEASQIPTVRLTRASANTGSDKLPFNIYVQSRYFSKYDVIALENTQLMYVLAEPERISDEEFKLTVQLVGSSGIDTRFTAQNKTLRYTYNMHPEYSEYGTNKHHYNTEQHINYLTKLRAGQAYSNDFKATEDLYFMDDDNLAKAENRKGGTYQVFKLSSIESQVLDHLLKSANASLLFGRTTIDSQTGRSTLQLENGQDVIAGDGIIPQYERYAYYIDYNNLNVKDFQDAIEHICDKRGDSVGNHITVICNRRFSRQKHTALQNSINLFAPNNNGTWFFSKEKAMSVAGSDPYTKAKLKKVEMPNEVVTGATFNTYVYDGNTITFVVDEALTNHYRDRGYAIFIDTGLYEDENGQVPAVHLKTLKGRSLVKSYIGGMGGIDGKSDGLTSNALDAGRFEALAWRGACVLNPFAAVIFEENV